MKIGKSIKLTALVLLFLASEIYGQAEIPAGSIYNICDYGAVGDGKTVNTATIQKAIDDCHASGGGRMYFSGVNYVTGTLQQPTANELMFRALRFRAGLMEMATDWILMVLNTLQLAIARLTQVTIPSVFRHQVKITTAGSFEYPWPGTHTGTD